MGLENTVPRRWYWDFGGSEWVRKKFPPKVVLGFGGQEMEACNTIPEGGVGFCCCLLLVGVVNR